MFAKALDASTPHRAPPGRPQNGYVNDLPQRGGIDPLPEVAALDWTWAADLPEEPQVDEELVQGLIGRMALSVIYGDSNSGKTFLVIDLARAVAERMKWMGRHTLGGLVVYVASEAPRSVCVRLQASQKHYGRRIPNFVIVKSPINLFDGTADASAVVDLIRTVEAGAGQKCELLIVDTVASASAGANENSGEDMGTVIKHTDFMRRQARAHVMLVHHSGKDQARGARGWSGLRAAIDTEIEVTVDEGTGLRAAEITKQRDIPGKGDRIGFRLESVDMGAGQWDTRRTSCVVVPADAPAKVQKGKRVSEVAGAIKEALRARGTGMKRKELAEHLDQYTKNAVYKEISKLIERHQLIETAGLVALNKSPPSAFTTA